MPGYGGILRHDAEVCLWTCLSSIERNSNRRQLCVVRCAAVTAQRFYDERREFLSPLSIDFLLELASLTGGMKLEGRTKICNKSETAYIVTVSSPPAPLLLLVLLFSQ